MSEPRIRSRVGFVRCTNRRILGPLCVGGILTFALTLVDPLIGMPASADAAFLAENRTAMSRMMQDMDIKPSGDVDRDFVGMMVPHHQGAIEMAQAELRYGRNEQLRRMAQEIIVDQMQEIGAMKLALGQPLPSPLASDQPVVGRTSKSQAAMPTMSMRKDP